MSMLHALPNVLEARTIRKLVPKHDVSLRTFLRYGSFKKERAQQISPGGAKKKESSSRALNEIKSQLYVFPSFLVTIALVIDAKN